MSRNLKSHKLDLKLNLSLLPAAQGDTSRRSTADEVSSPGSCLSSEEELGEASSPASREAASMVVAGCPQCLMYVMLSEDDLRCPKCRSTVLLYFCGDDGVATAESKSAYGSKKKA